MFLRLNTYATMLKKLAVIAAILFLFPAVTYAAPVSWDFSTNILQPLQSGWTALIKGDHFQATSTTASSTLPKLESTILNTITACINGDCRTTWPSSSGTNYLTNSGANTYLNTGTNLQAPVLMATSTTATSTFANAVQIGTGTPATNLLRIVGMISGPSSSQNGGLLNIQNSLNNREGLVVYTNNQVGASSGSPLVRFQNDFATHTVGMLRINSSGTSGADYEIKLVSPNPDIEFAASGQAAPAGSFEIDVGASNDALRLNGRNAADSGFYPTVILQRQDVGGRVCIGCGTSWNTSSLTPIGGTLEVIATTTLSDTPSSLFMLSSRISGQGDILNILNNTGATNGNVGISTTSPYSKLSVAGQVVAANYISTTTGTSLADLKLSGITGSTQCLHVDTNGLVSGTGSDCGSGGGTNFFTNSGANTYLNTGSVLQAPSFQGTSTATSTFVGGLSAIGANFSNFLQLGSRVINSFPGLHTDIWVCASSLTNTAGCDYIATGTGDQTAIQAGINAANALGGAHVLLSSGTFNVSATSTISTAKGVDIGGMGWSTIVNISNAANAYAFATNSGADGVWTSIHDLRITANATNQNYGGCIFGQGMIESRIDNVWCYQPYTWALSLTKDPDMSGYGHNNIVTRFHADQGSDSPGNGGGVFTDQNDENLISNSDFQYMGGASRLYDEAIVDTAGLNTYDTNTIVSSKGGFRAQDASRNKYTNNTLDRDLGNQFMLKGTGHLAANNKVYEPGYGSGSGSCNASVFVWDFYGQNQVVGNTVESSNTTGETCHYIHQVSAGSDSGRNVITGNNFNTDGALGGAADDFVTHVTDEVSSNIGLTGYNSTPIGYTIGTNLGVGTTSPFARVSIAAASLGTANLFAISTSTASATTTAVRISQNGNLHMLGGTGIDIGTGNSPGGNNLLVLGTASTTNLTISGISGSTQCLHVSATGVVSGTGSDCGSGGSSFSYPFPVLGLGTTSPIMLLASTTIGAGGQTTGLTVNGGATTTLTHYFGTKIGIATSTPMSPLSVIGNSWLGGNSNHFGTSTCSLGLVGNGAIGAELCGNTETPGGLILNIENDSRSTSAFSGVNFANADSASALTFAGIFFNSPTYNYTGYGTALAIPSNFSLENTQGNVTFIAATTSPTSAYFNWLTEGANTTNERMRLSSSTLTFGVNGLTNPAFQANASTTNAVTGLKLTSNMVGNGVSLQTTSSGTNEALTILTKGTGNMNLMVNATNRIVLGSTASTYANAQQQLFTTFATSNTAVNPRFNVTDAADPALTASTEAPWTYFNGGSATRTHAAGSLLLQRDFRVTGTTHAFASASTLNEEAAFAVDGPPSAGTNATITNSYGILIATSTVTGTVGTSTGLVVNAATGATTNYAATFLGGNVGVGTTSPFKTLSVGGTFAVSALSAFATGDSAVCQRAGGEITVDSGVSSCIISSKFVKDPQGDIAYQDAYNRIMKLQAVMFRYKDSGKEDLGLYAEDVAKIDSRYAQYVTEEKDIDGHHFDVGDPTAINWSAINADMIVVLQHQSLGYKASRTAENNWYWIAIGLLTLGFGWQQFQINTLKRRM